MSIKYVGRTFYKGLTASTRIKNVLIKWCPDTELYRFMLILTQRGKFTIYIQNATAYQTSCVQKFVVLHNLTDPGHRIGLGLI